MSEIERVEAIVHDWTCGCGKGQRCPNRDGCREAAEQIVDERASASRLEPVLKFVRLPDGRWAVENGVGVADVTRDDVEGMHAAWMLWAGLRWERAE